MILFISVNDRQWIVIGIGLAWHNVIAARWSAIRDSAHEKLFPLLQDPVPEVNITRQQ